LKCLVQFIKASLIAASAGLLDCAIAEDAASNSRNGTPRAYIRLTFCSAVSLPKA